MTTQNFQKRLSALYKERADGNIEIDKLDTRINRVQDILANPSPGLEDKRERLLKDVGNIKDEIDDLRGQSDLPTRLIYELFLAELTKWSADSEWTGKHPLELVKDTRVFVLDKFNVKDHMVKPEWALRPFFLGEPFDMCWFEGRLTEESAGLTILKDQIILGLWLMRGDKQYVVITASITKKGKISDPLEIRYDHIKENEYIDSPLHALVHLILSHIRSKDSEMGIERINKKIKLKSKQGKSIHRIRKIIHIRHKKDYSPSLGTRNIVWTHVWDVMGHWRKVPGIGKDDRGEYVVQGLTWVKPCKKGKGREVKKVRIA